MIIIVSVSVMSYVWSISWPHAVSDYNNVTLTSHCDSNKTDWGRAGAGAGGGGNISKAQGGLVNSELALCSKYNSPPRVWTVGTTGGEDILFQFPVLLLPTIRTPPPIWDHQPPEGMRTVYPLQPNQSQIENSGRGMRSLRISINHTRNFVVLGEMEIL